MPHLRLPELKRIDEYRFERLELSSGFAISIQGSSLSYCEPRTNLPSVNDYETLEVAVFHGNNWIIPVGFKSYFERGPCPVAANVPKDVILNMIASLSIQYRWNELDLCWDAYDGDQHLFSVGMEFASKTENWEQLCAISFRNSGKYQQRLGG